MLYLLSLVCLAYALELEISNVCLCNDINYQADCTKLVGVCDWVNGGCSIKNCPQCSNNSQGTSSISTSSSSSSNTPLCSTNTDYSSCQNQLLCTWTNKMCRLFQCSDYTTSISCQMTLSEDSQRVRFCNWIGQSCVEVTSLSSFDASTCYSKTFGLATWNPSTNQCKQCGGSSNSLLLILGLLSGFMM